MSRLKKYGPFTLWVIIASLLVFMFFKGSWDLLDSQQNATKMNHTVQNDKKTEEKINDINDKASFDSKEVKPISGEQFAAAQLNYEKIVNQWGIGALYIPSSNIHSKILAGLTDDNLSVGVGTRTMEQRLGKGNYVVMAHNLVENGGVLRDLPSTSVNTLIYTTDFTRIYEYQAKVNKNVLRTEGHYQNEPEEDEPAKFTVFRCEGGEGTNWRALVQGDFVRSYAAYEADPAILENLGLVRPLSDQQTTGTDKSTLNSSETDNSQKLLNENGFNTTEPVWSAFEKACISVFKFAQEHLYIAMGILVVPMLVSIKFLFS